MAKKFLESCRFTISFFLLFAATASAYALTAAEPDVCRVTIPELSSLTKGRDPVAGFLVGVGKVCKVSGAEALKFVQDLAIQGSIFGDCYEVESASFKAMENTVLKDGGNQWDISKNFYGSFVPEFAVVGPAKGVIHGVEGMATAKNPEEAGEFTTEVLLSGAALIPIAKGVAGLARLGSNALCDGLSAASRFGSGCGPYGLIAVGADGAATLPGGIVLEAAPKGGYCGPLNIHPELSFVRPWMESRGEWGGGTSKTPKDILRMERGFEEIMLRIIRKAKTDGYIPREGSPASRLQAILEEGDPDVLVSGADAAQLEQMVAEINPHMKGFIGFRPIGRFEPSAEYEPLVGESVLHEVRDFAYRELHPSPPPYVALEVVKRFPRIAQELAKP